MFIDEVFTQLKKVPKGQVTTYALLAQAVGRPGAARAVGNALNKNTQLGHVPCHRVVRSNGRLGGFVLGPIVKEQHLQAEGVKIEQGRVVDFTLKLHKF